MTTSVSRRLNIHCITYSVGDCNVYITTLFARLYVRVDILLTYGTYFNVDIISLIRDGLSVPGQ